MGGQFKPNTHVVVALAEQLGVRSETHRFVAILTTPSPQVIVHGL